MSRLPPARLALARRSGLATLVALAILIGLGTWQLQRKAWKEDLIAQIQARAYGEPGAIVPQRTGPPGGRTRTSSARCG